MVKKCIDFNTGKRKNAANSFEKYFFKLMNNSAFGKTMENLWKRINVRLVNNAKDYIQYTNKPTFVSKKIFNKSFVEIKPVLTLDKPIYVRLSFVDLNKYLMHEFHYKHIKKLKLKKMLNFCLQTELVWFMKLKQKLFLKIFKSLFDFSDYPQDSNFSDPVNKKVIGKISYLFSQRCKKSIKLGNVNEINEIK